MSKDKQKYLAAYIPETKPKETPKRSGIKSDGRMAEIEEAIRAFNDLLTKQTRDNLDAMYNIDMDNMSSSMRRLFQSYDDGITKANASIEAWANAQEAGFKAIAEWQSVTLSAITSIDGKADANSASITLLNQWKNNASSSIAAVQTMASQNSAKISSLVQWQSTVEGDLEGLSSSVAYIEELADKNGASISQIVEAVGKNGEVNAASIVAAVNAAGSSVKIDADKVDITGFVTFESLEEDGGSTINGNNVSLILYAEGDDGKTDISSQSSLNFIYQHYRSGEWHNKEFANIYTSIDGSDSDETSRYTLNISANRFYNDLGDESFASLKLEGAGRVSIWGQYGIYISTSYQGYIALNTPSGYNTRIVAAKAYSQATSYVSEASNSYHFATDGIYYNGVKYAGGGSGVAVFG